MAVVINTGFVQVNQLRNNANFVQGKGAFNSWTYNTKANIMIGQVAGNANIFPTGVNVLNDMDALDQLLAEGEFKPPIGPSIVEGV